LINSAVIPAAGIGTRLLSLTKETPKEMVPLFSKFNSVIIIRPLIEIIFLQLFDAGIRNFYFIIGKNKRSIEDHFTSDFIELPQKQNKIFNLVMKDFYKKVEESNIVWIKQDSPKGFGDAVLKAKHFLKDKSFIVHAGDTYIRGNDSHITNLIKTHEKFDSNVTLYIRKITNPKAYGVAEAKKLEKNIYKILRVEEKPPQPKSNFALMPLYIFRSKIFEALSKTELGVRNELQLTDGIQKLITWTKNGIAIKFKNPDDCIDIGTPQNYFRALNISFRDSNKTN